MHDFFSGYSQNTGSRRKANGDAFMKSGTWNLSILKYALKKNFIYSLK